MYKFRSTGREQDHEGYEWVEQDGQCEHCGHINRECTCGNEYEDEPDEPTVLNHPAQKSFHDRYGFDERDGPPEDDEEEFGYVDDEN